MNESGSYITRCRQTSTDSVELPVWAQVVKIFSAPERTGGCGGCQRAGEEKNAGVEVAAGQRATVNHWMDSTSQETFFVVNES